MAERLKEKFLEEEKIVDLVVGPDAYRDLPGLVAALENHLVISRAMLNLLTYENNSMKESTQNLIELIESELSKAN